MDFLLSVQLHFTINQKIYFTFLYVLFNDLFENLRSKFSRTIVLIRKDQMVRRKRSASFEKKYLYLDKDFFEELSFPVLLHLHFQLCMIFQKRKTLLRYLDK